MFMFCIYLVSRYLINYICLNLSSINIYLLLIINKMQPTEFCENIANLLHRYADAGGGYKVDCKSFMKSDSEMLDEVMVVAYGTAKKSAFTGSASVIKSETLEKRQVSNISNALSGTVSGVQTQSTNGQPGEKLQYVFAVLAPCMPVIIRCM